jgi:hypothetical protein
MFFLSYRDKNWEGPFLRMFLESPTSIFIPSSVSEDFLYPFVIVALAVVEGCFEKIQFFIIQYYNSNQHTDCNRFVKTTHFIRSCIESFFGLAHRHSTHQNRNIALVTKLGNSKNTLNTTLKKSWRFDKKNFIEYIDYPYDIGL